APLLVPSADEDIAVLGNARIAIVGDRAVLQIDREGPIHREGSGPEPPAEQQDGPLLGEPVFKNLAEMFPLAPRLVGMLLYHFGLQQLLCEACAGQSIADLLECERAFGGLQRAEPRKPLVVAAIVHAVHAA